jgi:hypothetical protein
MWCVRSHEPWSISRDFQGNFGKNFPLHSVSESLSYKVRYRMYKFMVLQALLEGIPGVLVPGRVSPASERDEDLGLGVGLLHHLHHPLVVPDHQSRYLNFEIQNYHDVQRLLAYLKKNSSSLHCSVTGAFTGFAGYVRFWCYFCHTSSHIISYNIL